MFTIKRHNPPAAVPQSPPQPQVPTLADLEADFSKLYEWRRVSPQALTLRAVGEQFYKPTAETLSILAHWLKAYHRDHNAISHWNLELGPRFLAWMLADSIPLNPNTERIASAAWVARHNENPLEQAIRLRDEASRAHHAPKI
jgi:hypothetical protein